VFLLTRDQFALTSSTYIKQIVELGFLDPKGLARLVPPLVAERLRRKALSGDIPPGASSPSPRRGD